MAYAIFYNHQDLTAIAANVEATLANNYDQYLTTQQRNFVKQTFQRAWTGGLNAWSTSPFATEAEQIGPYDPLTRKIVVSGAQVSLFDLIEALMILGSQYVRGSNNFEPAPTARVPGAEYMFAIAKDMHNGGNYVYNSAAREPWPPA